MNARKIFSCTIGILACLNTSSLLADGPLTCYSGVTPGNYRLIFGGSMEQVAVARSNEQGFVNFVDLPCQNVEVIKKQSFRDSPSYICTDGNFESWMVKVFVDQDTGLFKAGLYYRDTYPTIPALISDLSCSF